MSQYIPMTVLKVPCLFSSMNFLDNDCSCCTIGTLISFLSLIEILIYFHKHCFRFFFSITHCFRFYRLFGMVPIVLFFIIQFVVCTLCCLSFWLFLLEKMGMEKFPCISYHGLILILEYFSVQARRICFEQGAVL